MIDKIIRIYGFESETTIMFCKLAERVSKIALIKIYIVLVVLR